MEFWLHKPKLKVEDFQTLDETTLYVDRPYARLPQFLLNYKTGNVSVLELRVQQRYGLFKRTLGTIDSDTNDSCEPSGTRVYNDFLYAITHCVHRGLSPFQKSSIL